MVILNTGRSPQLNSTLAKLNTLRASYPNIQIAMYGYNEWLMYKRVYQDYYYKYGGLGGALIRNCFYRACRLVVEQHEAVVLHAAVRHAFELQRSLQRLVRVLLRSAVELLAVLVYAADEEHG